MSALVRTFQSKFAHGPGPTTDRHLPEQDVRDFLARVRDEAKEKNLHFFAVADNPLGGASVTVGSSPAVVNARKAHMRWERKSGIDPKHDWSKHASSFEGAFTKDSELAKESSRMSALVRTLQSKTAATRYAKIIRGAEQLKSLPAGTPLTPAQKLMQEQASAVLANPKIGPVAAAAPKDWLDYIGKFHAGRYLEKPERAAALAEAANPTTLPGRLKELLQTPHREIVEAAATNPNVDLRDVRQHYQAVPRLAEANPSLALQRMIDPLAKPPEKLPAWKMRTPEQWLGPGDYERTLAHMRENGTSRYSLSSGFSEGHSFPGNAHYATFGESPALFAKRRAMWDRRGIGPWSVPPADLQEFLALPKTAAFVAQRPLPAVGSVQEALQGTRGIEGLFASSAANPQLAAELPPGKRGVLFTRNLEETRKHLADALKIPVEQVNERVAELIRRSTMRHELTHAMRERAGKMEGFGKPGLRNVLRSYREEGIASMEGLRALEKLKAHQTNPELVAQIATGTLPGIQTSVQHAYKPHGGILRGALSGSLKPLLPIAERLGVLTKKAAAKNVTFAGVPVRIDRPKGYVQKGVGPDGNVRYRTYHTDYGYIPGTKGGDGEGFDVFLGPKENGRAFLIHQKKDDGTFDEFKLMLGYADPQSAKAMYLKHIPQKYMGSFQEVPVAMIQGLRGKEVNHKQIMMKKAEAVWDSFFDNIE